MVSVLKTYLCVFCLAQHQGFLDAAFLQALLHLGGEVDEGPAAGDLKPEFFAVAFQEGSLLNDGP
jgi:hypothetical protein